MKHNVLTAYTPETGFDLLRRFPNVDAILVHGSLFVERKELLREARALAPKVPIILATPFQDHGNDEADYVINSHHPEDLLKLLGDKW